MRGILILSAAANAATGVTAPAQEYSASRKESEQTMALFARCQIKTPKGRAAALAFTREVAGTPSTYPRRLVVSNCLRSAVTKLKFPPELFRMALFPALYRQDYARGPVRAVAAVAPLDHAAEFDGTPQPDVLVIRTFGDCVARRDPGSAHALLASDLYSDGEAAALVALRPALAACVVDGQTLRFSRTVLYGAIGEAMYKLSVAADATKAN